MPADAEFKGYKSVIVQGLKLEAGAIAAYRQGVDHPVISKLVCDEAPQFKLISEELGWCWVHEGRHYKIDFNEPSAVGNLLRALFHHKILTGYNMSLNDLNIDNKLVYMAL